MRVVSPKEDVDEITERFLRLIDLIRTRGEQAANVEIKLEGLNGQPVRVSQVVARYYDDFTGEQSIVFDE